jgi:hypothetical protein
MVAAGFVLYVVTLNRWVSLDGIDVVSKVAGWDWNTMQLGPVACWSPGRSAGYRPPGSPA